jgi:hypothetical protein
MPSTRRWILARLDTVIAGALGVRGLITDVAIDWSDASFASASLRLIRSRKKEPAPGVWGDPLRDPYICSYPPEDLRIEAYGDYLKKRGKSLLAVERAVYNDGPAALDPGVPARPRRPKDRRARFRRGKRRRARRTSFDRPVGRRGRPFAIIWVSQSGKMHVQEV